MSFEVRNKILRIAYLEEDNNSPPSSVDALADLLGDLHGDDVVAVDVLVVEPAVRRPHEVLVLHVDEPLGAPDGRRVGARDRVVHGAALLRRERGLVLQLKPAAQSSY